MVRHRFDPISFVLGLLAIAAAVVVLAGGELSDEGRILLPIGLIAVGISLLIEVARRPASSPAAAPAGDGLDLDTGLAGTGDDRTDRVDPFAPVDDVPSTWDPAAEPRADAPAARAADDTLVRPDPAGSAGDTIVPPDRDDTLVPPRPPGAENDTLVPPATDDDTIVPPGDDDNTLVRPGDDDSAEGGDDTADDVTLVPPDPAGADDDTLVPPGDDDTADGGESGTAPDGRPG